MQTREQAFAEMMARPVVRDVIDSLRVPARAPEKMIFESEADEKSAAAVILWVMLAVAVGTGALIGLSAAYL